MRYAGDRDLEPCAASPPFVTPSTWSPSAFSATEASKLAQSDPFFLSQWSTPQFSFSPSSPISSSRSRFSSFSISSSWSRFTLSLIPSSWLKNCSFSVIGFRTTIVDQSSPAFGTSSIFSGDTGS